MCTARAIRAPQVERGPAKGSPPSGPGSGAATHTASVGVPEQSSPASRRAWTLASVAVATALTRAASESATGSVTTILTVPGRNGAAGTSPDSRPVRGCRGFRRPRHLRRPGGGVRGRGPAPYAETGGDGRGDSAVLAGRVRGDVGGGHQPRARSGEALRGGDLGEVPVRVDARVATGDLGVEDPGPGADAAAENGAAADPDTGPQPPEEVVEPVPVLVPVAQFAALRGRPEAYGRDGAPLVARRVGGGPSFGRHGPPIICGPRGLTRLG